MADHTPEGQGFLARWSSRKLQAREGHPPGDASDAIESEANISHEITEKSAIHSEKISPPDQAREIAPPPPNLNDVTQLTPDSDFSRFVRPEVDPQVRNAAMRKLFAADPHFNVMDGLDVYIDDYSQGETIPKAMLRQMLQARALGLLDDELEDQDKPPSADAPAGVAANDTAPTHENADLQLQRDDAAEPGSAEGGVEPPSGIGGPGAG
ncbi:MAG: hypothetical protein RLZZ126_1725 [Pseudomonadota bacterium]|jgi:hypothetical protein